MHLGLNLAQYNHAWNRIREYTLIWGGRNPHICMRCKTTPNNHPSHVGCDTSTPVCDTSPVDLENSYWINMEARVRSSLVFILLRPSSCQRTAPSLHSLKHTEPLPIPPTLSRSSDARALCALHSSHIIGFCHSYSKHYFRRHRM